MAQNVTYSLYQYMLDIIRDIFKSDAGSFAFVFFVLVAIALAFYKIGTFKSKFDSHEKDLEETKKHTGSITQVTADHNTLEKRFTKVEDRLEKILDKITYINAVFSAKNDSLTQTNSPLSLTPEGKKVIEDNGIGKMIDDSWSRIMEASKDLESKNPYDIQQFFIEKCTVDLDSFFCKDNSDSIKLVAFNNGLSLASIARAIAVVIRDRYFKEHNILLSDIDDHIPNDTNP